MLLILAFEGVYAVLDVRFGSLADYWDSTTLMSVYGLLLIASTLLMADLARLHTYIRPLGLAYVDAGP